MRYEGRLDLGDIEHEMARLDAVYRPIATKPIDVRDLDAFTNIGAVIRAGLLTCEHVGRYCSSQAERVTGR